MVAFLRETLTKFQTELRDEMASLVQHWKDLKVQDLASTSLRDFGKMYSDRTNKLLVRLMKETTACLDKVNQVCAKVGASPRAFTKDLVSELNGLSQTGLQVFAMGTSVKLIESRAAAKGSPNSSSKASLASDFDAF